MTKIAKYEIIKEIGRGGFAVVYKARDTTLDRVVALKVLHPQLTIDPKFLQRFHQEARTAARLHHPNIATVYEVGEEAGQHYLAMVYLPGRTLDQWMAEGPLPLAQAVSIVEQIASALDAIHERGVVHRDVKPGNVIVDDRGQVTLLDFGIVRAAEGTRLTTTMAVLGTPEYMSPEQAEGQDLDHRADLYALGVVAYQMLAGQVPFSAPSPLAVLRFHADKAPPSPCELNPRLPDEVEKVLLKALAKKREKRYQSAGELARALREAVDAEAQTQKERKARPAQLYQQMQAAAAREDWDEVLALGEQIQALAPGYRDLTTWMDKARTRLSQPTARPRPSAGPSIPSLPGWVWAVGAVGLVVILFLGAQVLGIGSASKGPSRTPTASHTPTPQPTNTLTPTPTLGPGAPRIRVTDGMTMVYVPGGTFQMGSTDNDVDNALQLCNEYYGDCQRSWFEDEQPAHDVTLDSFWIDQTEVTNEQYRRCVDDGDCEEPGCWDDSHFNASSQPVVCVSWNDAQAYCEWAGGWLPTEAQWEYAARGTDGRIYPWGNDPPTCELANFYECEGGTVSVGSLPDGASWCGVHDMAGNVWEWVADWFGNYPSAPQTNPVGPNEGNYKVLRGGSWFHDPDLIRSAYRNINTQDGRYDSLGYRCVSAPGE